MKSTIIVLRSGAVAARDVFRGPIPFAAGAGAPSVKAEVTTVERKQIPALTLAADVLAVAPAMRMKLVEPRDMRPVQASAQEITWGVKAVRADTSPLTGEGIVVAVLDTGIDASHPAFAGVELVQKDFTGEGNGDQHGHGTHCAGTIFGRKVNGMRIGVAPGVKKALIGKVLGSNGGGTSDQITKAILWAIDEGANVISMSLGMDFPGWVQEMIEKEHLPPDLATARALEDYRANTLLFDNLSGYVKARGSMAQATVIVAAAGNESHREINAGYEVMVAPPAVADGIVSVAALGAATGGLRTADFSNTGANVSGPGVDIISAAPGGGLQSMSGTSMATPHVAGVAALWAQRLKNHGGLNAFQLVARLAGNATTAGLVDGFDPADVGAGLVQCPQEA